MPALGATIPTGIEQIYLGQVVRNVYHYNTSLAGPSDTPEEIFGAFNGTVGLFVRAVQSSGLQWIEAVIENLDDELFFAEIPILLPGILAGELMPSYVAYGVKLSRTFKTTRNGSKRFAGAVETFVSGNVHSLPGAATTAVEDALTQLLTVADDPGLEGAYTPIIFRPAGSVPSSPLAFSNPISAAIFSPNMTSQVSRKAGTGE